MRTHRQYQLGMTILEIMIVIAIIGGMAFLVRNGFRLVTKADLVENSGELAAILRRAGQLSIEHGHARGLTSAPGEVQADEVHAHTLPHRAAASPGRR